MALFALIPSYLSGTTRLILLVNFGGMIDIDMTFCKKILNLPLDKKPLVSRTPLRTQPINHVYIIIPNDKTNTMTYTIEPPGVLFLMIRKLPLF